LRPAAYNGVMRHEQRLQSSVGGELARIETSGAVVSHIAEMARTLVAMGGLATSISSSAHVEATEAEAICRFLPELAARHGLAAQAERRGDWLTVTFERRPS
jgi:hypothetical protein